jgi:DNA-binding response OmpR family regulator
MKTLYLLLGSTERILNTLVETTVLDVCYDRAAVQCTKAGRLGEFLRTGSLGRFDLLILAPDRLLSEPGRAEASSETLVQSVWTLKNQSSAPLITLGAPPEEEYRLLEAGVDAFLPLPCSRDELRAEVERLLNLPAVASPPRQKSWSLSTLFGRNGS